MSRSLAGGDIAISASGMHAGTGDGSCIGGGQLEERGRRAEDLFDGVSGQASLVRLVSRRLPHLPAPWQRRERRLGHRLPLPARDTPLACARAGFARLDELTDISLAADLVPDETQPRQGFLDQLALCRTLSCHRS